MLPPMIVIGLYYNPNPKDHPLLSLLDPSNKLVMLVTHFPTEMENDDSKINPKDTPATSRGVMCKADQSPLSSHSRQSLRGSATRAGAGEGVQATGCRPGEAGEASWQQEAKGGEDRKSI